MRPLGPKTPWDLRPALGPETPALGPVTPWDLRPLNALNVSIVLINLNLYLQIQAQKPPVFL